MKKISITILLLAFAIVTQAQWSCPSRLGGSLKPVGNSGFSWAAEVGASAGWVRDSYAGNMMAYLGLNYTKNHSSLYLEGGLKGWLRGSDKTWTSIDDAGNTITTEDQTHNIIPGLREAYYRFDNGTNEVTAGLQTANGDDEYLLNERIVGINYTLRANRLRFNAIGGTVMNAFARNGRFCSMGYIYNDLVVGRPRIPVGTDFGDLNFAMASLSLLPEKKEIDEFSDEKAPVLSLNKLGAVGYTEFGAMSSKTFVTSGLYAEVELATVLVKPEVIMQAGKDNNALIYNLSIDKVFPWANSQNTILHAQYVGYYGLDENARPSNSFSNLFLGDVLRQDVLEAPVAQLAIKHSFTKIKTSFKVQGTMQVKPSVISENSNDFVMDDYTHPTLPRMKELDISATKNFGKHVWLEGTFGMLNYPNLTLTDIDVHYNDVETMFGQLQCRVTF